MGENDIHAVGWPTMDSATGRERTHRCPSCGDTPKSARISYSPSRTCWNVYKPVRQRVENLIRTFLPSTTMS